MKSRIFAAVGAVAAVGGAVLGVATPASAATWGVSMWDACVQQHGRPSSVDVYAGYNVMGWRCRYDGGWNHVDMSINVDQWCRAKYGAVGRYSDFNNPYSWYCVR